MGEPHSFYSTVYRIALLPAMAQTWIPMEASQTFLKDEKFKPAL
jgi:hypothetical protein